MRISDWSSDVCSSDLAKTLKKKSDERTMGAKSLSSVSAGAIPPSYKRVIDTAPYLSKSEEYDLSVRWRDHGDKRAADRIRSEEHTSELQSLMRISYAVFCLKKKQPEQKTTYTSNNH